MTPDQTAELVNLFGEILYKLSLDELGDYDDIAIVCKEREFHLKILEILDQKRRYQLDAISFSSASHANSAESLLLRPEKSRYDASRKARPTDQQH